MNKEISEKTPQNGEKSELKITLNFNAKFQPVHRYDLEDALEEIFSKKGLGYLCGGGTMQLPTGEVKCCDIGDIGEAVREA